MSYVPPVQYTEGDTDASITGTAVMFEGAADALLPPSSANPFPVEVISGGGGGTQYTEGDTDASITGTALMVEDASDTLRAARNVPAANTAATSVGIPATGPTLWTSSGNAAPLAAASALSDGISGTNLAAAGLWMHTGSNWTRLLGTAANGVDVDVTRLPAGTADIGTVQPYAQASASLSGTTSDITGTSDTSVIAAQGAGVRIYVTHLVIQNSHATVSTWVQVKSGTTVRYNVYCAALGGGASIEFPRPLRLGDNEAMQVACVTTGANVRASASGYSGA